MTTPTEQGSLRKTKSALQRTFGNRRWFRGVGIAPSGNDLVLRLNVDDSQIGEDELPKEWEGQRIEIVYIRGYDKR